MDDQEWLNSQESPEDQDEALDFLRTKAKTNKRSLTRYKCPDCGIENALSHYEFIHHYHCAACTRNLESGY